MKWFQAGTLINTAYIERLNATFRQCLASFTRKGRMCARQIGTLTFQLYLVRVVYNFCAPHDSLCVDLGQPTTKTGRRWQPQTGTSGGYDGSLLVRVGIILLSHPSPA